jgi:hypothetical protein
MLAVLSGCGSGSGNEGVKAVTQDKSVEVTVDANGQFPESLAGTWRCWEKELEIIFEPNGSISLAVIPFGKAEMGPNATVEFNEVDLHSRGFFETGPFTTSYKPATRELTVELSLKNYRVEIDDGKGVIEGNSTDILVGKVSEDGKTWQADWFSIPVYYVTTEYYNNFKVRLDPNGYFEPQGTFIYHKESSP